jgi:hypothetical protein
MVSPPLKPGYTILISEKWMRFVLRQGSQELLSYFPTKLKVAGARAIK